MARRNRVTPQGDLIAVADHGLVYGNRGCLHDAHGEIRRGWAVRRWIACRLSFAGRRRRPLMAPGRYTELFFADEATAMAAGHRPCAECRRVDYRTLQAIWADVFGLAGAELSADAIDRRLHAERLTPDGSRRLHHLPFGELPDGAMVMTDGRAGRSSPARSGRAGVQEPRLVLEGELLRWTPAGYDDRIPRPAARVRAQVLTPPSLLALLNAGWDPLVPLLHPSARAGSRD